MPVCGKEETTVGMVQAVRNINDISSANRAVRIPPFLMMTMGVSE